MKGLLAIALVIVLIAGILIGVSLARRGDPRLEAQADAIRMASARKDAEASAWLPVRILAAVVALAIAGGGAGGVLWAKVQILKREARTIHADENGVMPAVVLRPGETLIDAGALAGPIMVDAAGPTYTLPPAALPQLQAGANQGAATTRTMRAWSTREPARREENPWPQLVDVGGDFPPVEILDGGNTYHLLEGEHDGG